MTNLEKTIFETIFDNSLMFLKRGMAEILSYEVNAKNNINKESGIISSLFTQMSIELALKAFLIKEKGLSSILSDNYSSCTEFEILKSFKNNELHTKQYGVLKNILISNERLTWFSDIHYEHLQNFQSKRNKIVHFNLFQTDDDLCELKYEIVYVIVHIIVPLLTNISFEFETPTSFYNTYLDKQDYQKLISFPPYVIEMEKIAKKYTGFNYYCPICFKKTYSPLNSLCYCCNLNYEYVVEYTDCILCKAKNSVIFDPYNIAINNHVMPGICLNCDMKMDVHKCPKCEMKYAFFSISELKGCTPQKCINE